MKPDRLGTRPAQRGWIRIPGPIGSAAGFPGVTRTKADVQPAPAGRLEQWQIHVRVLSEGIRSTIARRREEHSRQKGREIVTRDLVGRSERLPQADGAVEFAQVMPKDERIGVRIPGELKAALLRIAKKEGRSLAQVCEVFLRAGIKAYEKDGPHYLQRFIARRKSRTPTE